MKQTSLLIALTVALCVNVTAQYKKASFFTRNGKFYGASAGVHLYGNGVSAAPSLTVIWGKDKGKNRIWHWWDHEYTAGSKYSYTTVDQGDGTSKVDVTGKVNGSFTWRYNWAFYLADNKNEELKGLPFVKAALELTLGGRVATTETYSPESSYPQKQTFGDGVNAGCDLGAGYTYRVSETATLFGVAGYRWILNKTDSEYETFFPTPSHPYVNAGIRFSRKNDD